MPGFFMPLSLQERIAPPLLADTTARAVAAEKTDIIAQRQNLVPNGAEKGGMVATRQVGSPDRAVEQHVPQVRKPLLPVEIDHMAGRVAGAMVDIEDVPVEANLLTIGQKSVGL